MYAKKIVFGIPAHVLPLKTIIEDLVIICDKIAHVWDTVSIILNDKKATCKMDNYYILLAFL